MGFFANLIGLSLGFLPVTLAVTGKTYTSWDCCKPSCAWKQNLSGSIQGSAQVCDINNNPLANGAAATSGCTSGGQGYLCDTYSPTPTADDMSYGFAVMGSNGDCCKCYQLTWTSGNANGKSMVVQAIDTFSSSIGTNSTVSVNDIVILTPGGGVGPNAAGCRYQYGTTWGQTNGGVSSSSDCSELPSNLQGGCYWRYNWAKGDVNGWSINYEQVSCPSRLTSISGCSA